MRKLANHRQKIALAFGVGFAVILIFTFIVHYRIRATYADTAANSTIVQAAVHDDEAALKTSLASTGIKYQRLVGGVPVGEVDPSLPTYSYFSVQYEATPGLVSQPMERSIGSILPYIARKGLALYEIMPVVSNVTHVSYLLFWKVL